MTDYIDLAKQALERPSDFGWFGDDEMFVTWGITGPHHAINSDDVLGESNFEVLKELAAEKFGDDENPLGPHFDIAGIKHWAVGPMDSVITQVVKTDCAHPYLVSTANGFGGSPSLLEEDDLTEEFIWLCDIMAGLKDYPVLDEEDFSEREWEQNYQAFVDFGLPMEVDKDKANDIIQSLGDNFYTYIDEHVDKEDIYEAAYIVGAEDREFHAEEWDAWEFMNPSAVASRYVEMCKAAGQLELAS